MLKITGCSLQCSAATGYGAVRKKQERRDIAYLVLCAYYRGYQRYGQSVQSEDVFGEAVYGGGLSQAVPVCDWHEGGSL